MWCFPIPVSHISDPCCGAHPLPCLALFAACLHAAVLDSKNAAQILTRGDESGRIPPSLFQRVVEIQSGRSLWPGA